MCTDAKVNVHQVPLHGLHFSTIYCPVHYLFVTIMQLNVLNVKFAMLIVYFNVSGHQSIFAAVIPIFALI